MIYSIHATIASKSEPTDQLVLRHEIGKSQDSEQSQAILLVLSYSGTGLSLFSF